MSDDGRWIDLIGLGDDGLAGLRPGARAALDAAEVIAAREAAMTRDVEAGRPVSAVMGAAYEQMLQPGHDGAA